MATLRRVGAFAVLLLVLGGCAQQQPPANPTLVKEQSYVAPLKVKYKDVITGLDVKDRTLTVYVEPNAMYSMAEEDEAAMKAYALHRWKVAWTSAHPHKHATLRLSVRDYFGRELSSSSVNV